MSSVAIVTILILFSLQSSLLRHLLSTASVCQFRPVLVTSSVFVFVFVSVWCSTDGGDKRLRLRGQRAWRGHLRQPRLLLHRNAPQQDHLQHLSWVDGNSYTVLYTILVSSSLHRFAVLVIAQHGCSFSCFPLHQVCTTCCPFPRCVQVFAGVVWSPFQVHCTTEHCLGHQPVSSQGGQYSGQLLASPAYWSVSECECECDWGTYLLIKLKIYILSSLWAGWVSIKPMSLLY